MFTGLECYIVGRPTLVTDLFKLSRSPALGLEGTELKFVVLVASRLLLSTSSPYNRTVDGH